MSSIPLIDWNHNWINGEQVTSTETVSVLNPATGEVLGEVPSLSEDQVKAAVDAASAALPAWAGLTAKQRGDYLLAWGERILQNVPELALLLSQEQGKALKEATGEIRGSVEILRWYAEEAKRAYGEIIPASNPGQQLMVFREPVGVVGLITPMNFPAATLMRKVAPALAAGCTAILKPASTTSLIAVALFQHLMEIGLPKGVANLVTGSSSVIGGVLMKDSRVRKISFTGSTEVGKRLMGQAAQTVKKLGLELGGNSPAIVFPDADLDKAARDIVDNKFENCGQVCNGINLIYVHEDVHAQLVDKIVEHVKRLKVDYGTLPDTDIGPLIDQGAVRKVEALVDDAVAKGAKVLLGGSRLVEGKFSQGSFFAPTVLDQVTADMNITHEEIFGPVAPILTFKDEEEVLERANNTPYGLAAYFYTKDAARVYRLIQKLETGNIGVNGTSLAYVQAPFGGVKESGIGREGGRHGLDEYLESKYVAWTL
ncbi:NAD-dependent succinate-semialdehyde dehydrogenase [Brevibacillus centrosporus]|uniref:NAD-dependent succinate-semialdehyde dehydrogenase n=1 Tax=Brevibacillus centrosporus TaxID=54910 RepID=UPI003B01FD54